MIIKLTPTHTATELTQIESTLSGLGFTPSRVRTQAAHYVVATGGKEIDIRTVGHLPGVLDVYRVSDAYKLVSRKWKVHRTTFPALGIGEGALSLMLGPCSIESEEQVAKVCAHLSAHGVTIMRGGAFKPRTSPYSFRGMGIEGLKMFSRVARSFGIKIISEVLEIAQIEPMYEYVDIYQVGTRNTQNFSLLHELGRVDKPVLIKRGMSGTLEELLQSAEYVFANGNEKIILCERGIRTYEKAYRNTLDLNAVPVLREKSHLPVVVDPSHGMGIRQFVEPMALAAVMAGADGLLIEIHEQPEHAASDGQQTLNFDESAQLISRCRQAYGLTHGMSW